MAARGKRGSEGQQVSRPLTSPHPTPPGHRGGLEERRGGKEDEEGHGKKQVCVCVVGGRGVIRARSCRAPAGSGQCRPQLTRASGQQGGGKWRRGAGAGGVEQKKPTRYGGGSVTGCGTPTRHLPTLQQLSGGQGRPAGPQARSTSLSAARDSAARGRDKCEAKQRKGKACRALPRAPRPGSWCSCTRTRCAGCPC